MPNKNCVIYFKQGWLNARMCFGLMFDDLETCCQQFHSSFFGTGNTKQGYWGDNSLYNSETSGINLLIRGSVLKVFLLDCEIYFCPWCSVKIEVKKSKDVTLESKSKQVPDGYREMPTPPTV